MPKDNGGPAYPQFGLEAYGSQYQLTGGMSLRDYFAARVMVKMLDATNWDTEDPESLKEVAQAAYVFADAMIAERNKE